MTSGEIDLYGVFGPTLFVWMLVAFTVIVPIRFGLARSGFYQLVWHRPLFDLALYVITVYIVVVFATWLFS